MSYLLRHTIIHSIDELDQLRDIVQGADVEYTQLAPGRLRGTLVSLDLGGLRYDFHQASLPLRGKGGGSREELSFELPEVPTTINGCRLEPGHLFVYPPVATYEGQHCADYRAHLLTIHPQHLAAFAEQRGISIDVGSLHAGSIRCPPAAAQRLSLLCQTVSDGLKRGEIALDDGAALRHLHAAVLLSFCEVLAGAQTREPGRVAASYRQQCRVVRAAEEFLAISGLDAPSLSDLSAATGLPPRTLNFAFHNALGMSPARYLRILRLLAVRRALRRTPPDRASVTTIAMAHGFWHLGRFAQHYKEYFSELPSETLGGVARRRG
jgi:AraC family ethanolamine operon transcriptional activator